MGGHGHNRPRAIADHDIVGYPHGHLLPRHGINGVATREHACFFPIFGRALNLGRFRCLCLVLGHHRLLLGRGQLIQQRMFRSQHHKGCPPQRVGAGGKNLDGLLGGRVRHKHHPRPFGAANPIGLHQLDGFRPIQPLKAQQLLRILGNAEKPLAHQFLHNGLSRALIFTINDLFVGQHRLQGGRPINHRLPFVSQARLIEFLKKPLCPTVILGGAGNSFPLPIKHGPHAFHLFAHGFNVGIRPFPRVNVALHGRIFSGQAKRIEPHREQHIKTLHPHKTGAGIGGGHGEPMPHVQIATGVGQHGQGIMLGLIPIHL